MASSRVNAPILEPHAWVFTMRGVFSILFGLSAVLFPTPILSFILLLIGAYALVDGFFAIAAGIRAGTHPGSGHCPWVMAVLEGALGIGAGAALLGWTNVSLEFLVAVVGAWMLLTGLLEIAMAFALTRHFYGDRIQSARLLLGTAGVGSSLVGGAVLWSPRLGELMILTWVAVYAFFFRSSHDLVWLSSARLRERENAQGGTLLAKSRLINQTLKDPTEPRQSSQFRPFDFWRLTLKLTARGSLLWRTLKS